ncbi:MAG: hypothetical protein SFX73_31690 [Kofleriaceae bacterium]|nr:hypothetical protein [Kofleriaceae bacterium]
MARLLEPLDLDAALDVEITVVDELDDPWFVDDLDDGVVVVTEDAQMLDRSMRMRAPLLAIVQ